MNYSAMLFDLDGVVFDSEQAYTSFWSKEAERYFPGNSDIAAMIKGTTLEQILNNQFKDVADQHQHIIDRLVDFENNIDFQYVEGFLDFVSFYRKQGIKTAIVTSSSKSKMQHLFNKHKELRLLIDVLITSEDVSMGKPAPECYLKAAKELRVNPEECIVFEDSFNGLSAAKVANTFVVGLTTSNSQQQLLPYADIIIDNFSKVDTFLSFV